MDFIKNEIRPIFHFEDEQAATTNNAGMEVKEMEVKTVDVKNVESEIDKIIREAHEEREARLLKQKIDTAVDYIDRKFYDDDIECLSNGTALSYYMKDERVRNNPEVQRALKDMADRRAEAQKQKAIPDIDVNGLISDYTEKIMGDLKSAIPGAQQYEAIKAQVANGLHSIANGVVSGFNQVPNPTPVMPAQVVAQNFNYVPGVEGQPQGTIADLIIPDQKTDPFVEVETLVTESPFLLEVKDAVEDVSVFPVVTQPQEDGYLYAIDLIGENVKIHRLFADEGNIAGIEGIICPFPSNNFPIVVPLDNREALNQLINRGGYLDPEMEMNILTKYYLPNLDVYKYISFQGMESNMELLRLDEEMPMFLAQNIDYVLRTLFSTITGVRIPKFKFGEFNSPNDFTLVSGYDVPVMYPGLGFNIYREEGWVIKFLDKNITISKNGVVIFAC